MNTIIKFAVRVAGITMLTMMLGSCAGGGSSGDGSSGGGSSGGETPGNGTTSDSNIAELFNNSLVITLPYTSSDGVISEPGDADYFSFTLTQDSEITASFTNAINIYAGLYSSSFSLIATKQGSGNGGDFRIARRLPAGEYYMQVRGIDADTTGIYTFNIEAPTTIATLPYTSSRQSISPAADEDYFRVVLEQDARLILSTTGLTDTFGSLYDNSFEQIAFDDNSGDASNFLMIRELTADTYYIEVAGVNIPPTSSLSPGDYALNVEVPATIATLPYTSSGESISPARDVDYFRFSLTQANIIDISTSSSTDTYGRLYNEGGKVIAFDDNSGTDNNFHITQLLPAGSYYIEVKAPNVFTTTGSYTLNVAPQNPTILSLPNATSAESISSSSDRDYFRFETNGERVVTLFTTGTTDTFGRLYDSNAVPLDSDDNSGSDENFLIKRLLPAGSYYVEVSGGSPFTTASNYILNFIAKEPLFIPSPLTDTSPYTSIGQNISSAGDEDYFRFDLVQDTPLILTTTGATDTFGSLYDSSFSLIASDDNSGKNSNFFIGRELNNGTYYIEVKGTDSSATIGEYTLNVAVPRTITLPYRPSEETISPASNADYFRFEVTNVNIISITTNGSTDTYGRLYDGAGKLLAYDDNSADGNNFLIENILSNGIYYLVVDGANPDADGSYTLNINTPTNQAEISLIDPNPAVNGTISSLTDKDYFRFNVTQPNIININTAGATNTLGALYNSSGIQLASDNNSGSGENFLIRRLLFPGSYYIEVKSGNNTIGDYTLNVSIEEVPYINSSATSSVETLSSTQDINYFTFNVTQDKVITLFATGNINTYGRLYNSAGNTLASDNNSGRRGNFRITKALSAGSYYIEVRGGTPSTVGDYTLRVAAEESLLITLPYTSPQQFISPAGDEDYFTFTLSEDSILTAAFSDANNIYGGLYDSSFIEIASNQYSNDNRNFFINRELSAGTYHIQVRGIDIYTTGSYRLNIEVPATIATLPYTSSQESISPVGDEDYFRVVLEQDAPLILSTTGLTDTFGSLYDNSFGLIASKDNSGTGSAGNPQNFLMIRELAAGAYYIGTRGNNRFTTTGDYVLNVATPPTITLPYASAEEEISPAGNEDYFRFELTQLTIVTASTNGSFDVVGRLYDSAGILLAADDNSADNDNFYIKQILPAGSYYIAVSGANPAVSGEYTLIVTKQAPPTAISLSNTDSPNSDPDSNPVPSYATSGESISSATDIDYFSFSLSQTNIINIATTGSADTVGALYNSAGVKLAFDDNSGSGNNFFIEKILSPGTYHIEVAGSGSSTATGNYILNIMGAPTIDIPYTSSEQSISPTDNVDYFKFEVSELNIININTTGSTDTVGTLYNSAGVKLTFDDDSGSGNNFLIQRILFPGIYFAEVRGLNSNTYGNYTLNIATDEIPIISSPYTSSAQEISSVEDRDYFYFNLINPSVITLFTTGATDTYIRLYDDVGELLASDDNSGSGNNFYIERILPTGSYYIEVSGSSSAVGSYTLNFIAEEPPLITSPDTPSAQEITAPSDLDYFSFTLIQDSVITAFTTGSTDTYGRLYDSSVIQFASDDNSGNGNNFHIEKVLPAGSYYIEVSGSSSAVGSYTLNFIAEELQPISLPYTSSVQEIAAPGNADYFSFTLTQGAEITASFTDSNNIYGGLYDSSFSQLASASGNGDSFRITRVLSAGTYYMQVRGIDATTTGRYRFNIEAPTAITLPYTSPQQSISPIGDEDYVRVVLKQDAPLTISTTGSTDTYGRLFDASFKQLAFNDDSGDYRNFFIARELPAGTYYIETRGRSRYRTTGDYTLNVATPTTITLPYTSTGETISPAGNEDYFRFELKQSGIVVASTTGSVSTIGRLYNAAGKLLASDDNSANSNFLIEIMLSVGSYYLAVGGVDSAASGEYTLNIATQTTLLSAAANLPNATYEGTMLSATDRDYFTVNLTQDSVITANTTSSISTYLRLYDPDGVAIVDNNRLALERQKERIERIASAGLHYVEVYTDHKDFTPTTNGSYTLDIATELPPTITPPYTSSNETISIERDVDYFHFNLTQPRIISINTINDSIDTYVRLYDSAISPITHASSYSRTSPFPIIHPLSAGSHYVEINGFLPFTTGNYTLNVNAQPLPAITVLPFNVRSEITYPGEKNFLHFTLEQPSIITVYTDSNGLFDDNPYDDIFVLLDTAGTLYNANGFEIAYDDQSGGNDNFRIQYEAPAGTYYLEVKSFRGAIGGYTVHATAQPIQPLQQ